MSKKQKIALSALPVLAATMFLVYWIAVRLLGRDLAWYAGFMVYWPLWCVLFPAWMLGWQRLWGLFRHRRMPPTAWLVVILLPAVSLIGRFTSVSDRSGLETIAWILMAVVGGTLEEILWRGVYVELFPGDWLWGLAWPTVWFALWHFAPGYVAMGSRVWVLVVGAAVFGAALGWVALKTGSIRWTVVSHVLAGLARA